MPCLVNFETSRCINCATETVMLKIKLINFGFIVSAMWSCELSELSSVRVDEVLSLTMEVKVRRNELPVADNLIKFTIADNSEISIFLLKSC